MSERVATLRRQYYPEGTAGVLEFEGQTWYTVEPPWRDNATNKSCIPEGEYRLRPRWFNRKGYLALGVDGVPGRTHILIHRGNLPGHSRGCILVGLARTGTVEISRSKEGLDSLLKAVGREVKLIVSKLDDDKKVA